MIEQGKKLLSLDLCARLPYGVKVDYEGNIKKVRYIEPDYYEVCLEGDNFTIPISEVKPYLRPMNSMTEEEGVYYHTVYSTLKPYEKVDWLVSKHFDYRGLIEKGLAIEVTIENNLYKL